MTPPPTAQGKAKRQPIRIQRKRTKGWKMPENTVYVGRPSKWGNPYKIGSMVYIGFDKGLQSVMTLKDAVLAYSLAIGHWPQNWNDELRGKNLACWCPLTDKEGKRVPCHADILLELANA